MTSHHRFLDAAEVVAEATAFFVGIAAILSLLWVQP